MIRRAWTLRLSRYLGFEEVFAAFLFAGAVKDTIVLSWMPIDLTAAFLALSAFLGVRRLSLRNWIANRGGVDASILFATFVAYAALSLIWSPSREYAYGKFAHLAISCGWAFAGSALLVSADEQSQARFYRACAVISIVVACQFLALTAGIALGETKHWSDNYLGYGRLFCVGFVVVLASAMWARVSAPRLTLLFLALVPLGLGLLLGGGRGPLVALTAACVVPVAKGIRIAGPRILAQRRLIALLGGLMSVAAAILVLDPSGTRLKTVRRIVAFLTDGNPHSVGARLAYYRDSIMLWQQSPIWGQGLGSWPVRMGWGDVRGYPHNIVLEIAVELGLVGLVMFGLLLFSGIAVPCTSRRMPRAAALTTIMLVIAAVVNASFSGDLTDNKVLFATIGLAIGCGGRRLTVADDSLPSTKSNG